MSERWEEEVRMKDGIKKGKGGGLREGAGWGGVREVLAALLLKFDWSPRSLCNTSLQEQSEKGTNIQVLSSYQHKDRSIPIPNF